MPIHPKFNARPPMNAETILLHSLHASAAGTAVGAIARIIVSGMARLALGQHQFIGKSGRPPAWSDGRQRSLLAPTTDIDMSHGAARVAPTPSMVCPCHSTDEGRVPLNAAWRC